MRPEGAGFWHCTPQGNAHRWGTLTEGPRKKLHYLSFGAFEDDLPRFRDHLQRLNVERLTRRPASRATACGFAITTACRSKSASLKNPRRTPNPLSRQPHAGRLCEARSRAAGAETIHPRRLAHLALHPSDVGRAIEFYSKVLGFACLIPPKARSLSCTACTAAITIWSRSENQIGTGTAPLQLGRRSGSRDRAWRHADGEQRLRRRLGHGATCARLQLFPLCPRSLGQLLRIFRRHGLHSRSTSTGPQAIIPERTRSTSGGRRLQPISVATTKPRPESRRWQPAPPFKGQ